MTAITPHGKNEFHFNYDGVRTFELRANNTSERDTWVRSLQFLGEIKEKVGTSGEGEMGPFDSNPGASKGPKSSDTKLSELALEKKGISTYIDEIPEKIRKSRMMYGFMKKAGRGKVSFDHKRWLFLMSSRPLNKDSYINDNEGISDDSLPPLIEFDHLYYYEMSGTKDSSPCKGVIKCLDIDKMYIKSDGKIHSLHIDAGPKKYTFMSKTKYIAQQWMEAIELAKKTSYEKLYSVTGTIKNIVKIITQYEMDSTILSENLVKEAKEIFPDDKDWENIDELLKDC